MQLINNGGPSSGMEKWFKWLLLAGAGIVAFKFWGDIVPFVERTLEDTFKSMMWMLGIGAVGMFFVYKWNFIVMTYKNFCNYVENWFITKDPLSYMDRCVEKITEKLKSIGASIVTLRGKKIKLDRAIDQLNKDISTYKKEGAAAFSMGNKSRASMLGQQAISSKESIEIYMPLKIRVDRSIELLAKFNEDLTNDRDGLVQDIARKRQVLEIVSETVKGLKNVDDLLNSNSEDAVVLGKSIKALEERTTQSMGYIEDFEVRSKNIIEGIDIRKKSEADEGLKEIEEFINSGKLSLGEATKVQDIDYEVVTSKSNYL